jgi:hypothetical protein
MPNPLLPITVNGLCQTAQKKGHVYLDNYSFKPHPERLLSRRRPIVSLDVLPVDIYIMMSEYLSVKDLVLLMQVRQAMLRYVASTEDSKVNKRTRESFGNKSIWVRTLRDILRIRPIPRLLYALPTMAVAELVQACVRAYRLEKALGGNVTHCFTLRKQLELTELINPGSLLVVPGGRHYVLFLDHQSEISLFESESGRQVMEILKYKDIHKRRVCIRPKIIAISASDFLLGYISW